MSKAQKVAFILSRKAELQEIMADWRRAADDRSAYEAAMFARGGSGGSRKAAGKSGKSSKKAKGAQQSGSGGACCKTDGGKFAPGNNYGSLNKGSAKAKATRTGKAAGKAAQAAQARVEATKAGGGGSPMSALVARSRLAASKAAGVKAAKDREAAVAVQREARNAKAREGRAAKKAEAAKPKGPTLREQADASRTSSTRADARTLPR